MEREELNAAFERFLETGACREMEQDLLSLVHSAFVYGWLSAKNPSGSQSEKVNPLH